MSWCCQRNTQTLTERFQHESVIMHINNQFKLGDVVSLICSADDSKGMIVCIHAQISGTVTYSVAWGDRAETVHFHSELKLIAVSDNDFVREQ